MNDRKNIFDAFRERIVEEPGRKFEKHFWREFTRRFKTSSRRSPFSLKLLLPVIGALGLLVFFLTSEPRMPSLVELGQMRRRAEILGRKDELQDMEMLAAFETLPTSREKWSMLLGREVRDE
jgi:hypothetical protein